MKFNRSSGILLHPTSLPSADGIGDLGPDAYQWISQLVEMGCGLWQILPLGPTGYGDSPYQCFSAFAGNPYLISTLGLAEYGLLTSKDLSQHPNFPKTRVDFGKVIKWKLSLLELAYKNYLESSDQIFKKEIEDFHHNEAYWLEDFSLFMAIKENQHGQPWSQWPADFKSREKDTIQAFRGTHKEQIEKYVFHQFLFHKQWKALRDYANQNGILIIGDVPIFIAFDSADAWANPELFQFDTDLQPKFVAGVPPDYFSPTGQLWGNPLYDWNYHQKNKFAWWTQRLEATLKQVDIIRLDHFRGFVDYWEIPAKMPTAELGEWKPGPGKQFFDTLYQQIGDLSLIAEDLGQINPEVFALRDELCIPGMKIFQFGFGNDASDPFLPHNFPVNCVAYTGTHDNDTCIGWYENATDHEKDFCGKYVVSTGKDINWAMIRMLWSSVAQTAITTMQDILGKGSEARMNFPGRATGNWNWRFAPDELTEDIILTVRECNLTYGRLS